MSSTRPLLVVLLLSPVTAFSVGCGGGTSEAEAAREAEAATVPEAYEEARERLLRFTERRLVAPETEDVEGLIASAREVATVAAEETVAIARMFDQVVRDHGERWRARCLVGIAAANRALAVLIRTLEYTMPTDVEAQLVALAEQDADSARDAREEIESSIAEALESRAAPLDRNECTALRGAVAAMNEWPDPEMDADALRARIDELSCP